MYLMYFFLYFRSWCFYVLEKLLHAQSVRARECPEGFKTWVIGYDELTPIQQLRAVKKEADCFALSCNNLIANIKNSGTLKKISKDQKAETHQRKKDKEEFEGHVLPDPHKALPGICFIMFYNV